MSLGKEPSNIVQVAQQNHIPKLFLPVYLTCKCKYVSVQMLTQNQHKHRSQMKYTDKPLWSNHVPCSFVIESSNFCTCVSVFKVHLYRAAKNTVCCRMGECTLPKCFRSHIHKCCLTSWDVRAVTQKEMATQRQLQSLNNSHQGTDVWSPFSRFQGDNRVGLAEETGQV